MSGLVRVAPVGLLGIGSGQGWTQVGELGLAFALSSAIGLERELRQKSAGLRTYTLVGVASALIMLVSKYGFTDVIVAGRIVLDPSRVVAQVVSGIGFIGGGLIFVRRDAVRGLTTAAGVWLTAAVGMAAGAGLDVLAVAVTGIHFIVAYGYTPLARRLPRSRYATSQMRIVYQGQRGVLRTVMAHCTQQRGFTIGNLTIERADADISGSQRGRGRNAAPAEADAGDVVVVVMEVQGIGSITELITELGGLEGVLSVTGGDAYQTSE
jgi:putative Mg2+ transporter-C (MgtC) family protein